MLGLITANLSAEVQNLIDVGPYIQLTQDQHEYEVWDPEADKLIMQPIIFDFSINDATNQPFTNAPLVIIMHGNNHAARPFGVLRRHLASYGYHVIKPAWGGGIKSNEKTKNAMIAGLEYAFDKFPQYYSGDIIVVGHSRGGEAALLHSPELEGLNLNGKTLDVKSIISLHPSSNFAFDKTLNIESVVDNLMVMYSRNDGDVYGGIEKVEDINGIPHKQTPFKYFDEIWGEYDSNQSFSKYFLYHPYKHNSINVSVTDGGNLAAQSLSGNILAFLSGFYKGNEDYKNLIRQGGKIWNTQRVSYNTQYDQKDRLIVSNFNQPTSYYFIYGGEQNNSQPIGRVRYRNLYYSPEQRNSWEDDIYFVHDTGLLELSWINYAFYPYYIRGKLSLDYYDYEWQDVRQYGFLTFRIGQRIGWPWGDNNQSLPVKVTLVSKTKDINGNSIKRIHSVDIDVVKNKRLAFEREGQSRDSSRNNMNTVRIPLEKFSNVNLASVQSIQFEFQRSGSVLVDNVQFIKGETVSIGNDDIPDDPQVNIAPDYWELQSIDENDVRYYKLEVPNGTVVVYTGVQNMNGAIPYEDYDIYFKKDELPTEGNATLKANGSHDELSGFYYPSPGTWYIMVKNNSGRAGQFNFYAVAL